MRSVSHAAAGSISYLKFVIPENAYILFVGGGRGAVNVGLYATIFFP